MLIIKINTVNEKYQMLLLRQNFGETDELEKAKHTSNPEEHQRGLMLVTLFSLMTYQLV